MDKAKVAEKKLAEHFCEDPKKFKLEECLLLLADFFGKIKQAIVVSKTFYKDCFTSKLQSTYSVK